MAINFGIIKSQPKFTWDIVIMAPISMVNLKINQQNNLVILKEHMALDGENIIQISIDQKPYL